MAVNNKQRHVDCKHYTYTLCTSSQLMSTAVLSDMVHVHASLCIVLV
jgi:hypothetical protein